jgi:hypothetical protein
LTCPSQDLHDKGIKAGFLGAVRRYAFTSGRTSWTSPWIVYVLAAAAW